MSRRLISVAVVIDTRAPIDSPSSAGFLPLLSGAPSLSQAVALAGTLDRWAGPRGAILPSVPPDHPRHEPRRYWRGPIWAVVNWMVAEGFARHGEPASVRLRLYTRKLIETGGFAEYFDPRDGAGLGGGEFTWTAAIYLLLAG